MRLTPIFLLAAGVAPQIFCIAPATASAGNSPWLGSITDANIVFLAEANVAQIDRYDLTSQSWLSPIALPAVAMSFTAAGNALIVSDADATTRYMLDGTNVQVLPGALPGALGLGVNNGILFATPPSQVQSYDLQSLQQIDHANDYSYQTPYGFVIDSAHGRLVGNQLGIGPPSMVYWNVDANGIFGASGTSADFNYPIDIRNYPSADGTAVINSGGVVWSSTTELHVGSMGGDFDALVRVANNSVVLRGSSLYLVNANYHELGRYTLNAPANELATDGASIYAFHLVGSQPQAETVPLSAIAPPALPPPPDPARFAHVPDQIEIGPTGVVYLLSIAQAAIYRFDLNSWTYLSSVPLPEAPSQIAVDVGNGDVYVSYTSASIGVLRAGTNAVVPFAYSLTPLFGISVAGPSLMTVDSAGAWAVHRLVDKQFGRESASRDWNNFSKQYVWCTSRSRMYYYDDGAAPDNMYYETITPPTAISAPVPNYSQWGATIPTYPIRVDPSCNYLVNGAGQLFDAGSLSITTTLSEQPADIAWSGGAMYDILPGSTTDTAFIHQFNAANTIVGTGATIGSPQRLLSYGANLYAVTTENGHTLLTQVSPALTGNDLSVLGEASTPAPAANSLAAVEFDFFNQGPAGPAPSTISIAIPPQVTSINWVCQPAGAAEYNCGSDGPLGVNRTLAAGERFTVIAYFTTPAAARGQLLFDASIQSTSGGDAVLQNNAATITVDLDRLFADGFE
jgi:hypothetical protein